MSHLFYDHLIKFETLNSSINSLSDDRNQKEELWQIVDEILHHQILEFVLDNLHLSHHEEFIMMYKETPYDNSIMMYLSEKAGNDFEKKLEDKILKIEKELLGEFISN